MDGKGTEAAYKLNRIELSWEWIKIELHYNLNARRGVGGVEVDRQAPAHRVGGEDSDQGDINPVWPLPWGILLSILLKIKGNVC